MQRHGSGDGKAQAGADGKFVTKNMFANEIQNIQDIIYDEIDERVRKELNIVQAEGGLQFPQ